MSADRPGGTAPDTPSRNIHEPGRPLRGKGCPVHVTRTPSLTTRLRWEVTGTSTNTSLCGSRGHPGNSARARHHHRQMPMATRRGAQGVVCAHLKTNEARKVWPRAWCPRHSRSPGAHGGGEGTPRPQTWPGHMVHACKGCGCSHMPAWHKKYYRRGKDRTEMSRTDNAASVSLHGTRNIICLGSRL